jgi:hypothetical protein
MKILFGFHYHDYPVDVAQEVEKYLDRIRPLGYEIVSFPLTLQPKGRKENWKVLDRKWKTGDRQLMAMYERLARALDGCDLFFNSGAINVHPDFLSQMTIPKVMAHFDDPENAEDVSKPVAPHYDLCLVGNIAEVPTYKAWGAKRVSFWPIGFRQDDYDPRLTVEQILTGERDVPLTMLCERDHVWRRARLDAVASAFPEGRFHGLGWSAGFLPESERVPLLQRTKVGINIHNSTGPINVRTYALPANGVFQICDNKRHLGGIFELGTEVVGFDDIKEGIELCRYYLEHEQERRMIAAAGFERSMRDYNEKAIWQRAMGEIRGLLPLQGTRARMDHLPIIIQTRRDRTKISSFLWKLIEPAQAQAVILKKKMRAVRRRLARLLLGAPPRA